MEKPTFDRLDLKITLADGTASETITVYHDDLLEPSLIEALHDAETVNGVLTITTYNNRLPWWFGMMKPANRL